MDRIRVLIVRPNSEPEEALIDNSLAALRAIVGSPLERVHPSAHPDDAIIFCNAEGKFNGSKPNRPVFDEKPFCTDIIYGTFLICNHHADSEEISSLTDEQVWDYSGKYSLAIKHLFIQEGGDRDVQ